MYSRTLINRIRGASVCFLLTGNDLNLALGKEKVDALQHLVFFRMIAYKDDFLHMGSYGRGLVVPYMCIIKQISCHECHVIISMKYKSDVTTS